jgi:hypothetical protein
MNGPLQPIEGLPLLYWANLQQQTVAPADFRVT